MRQADKGHGTAIALGVKVFKAPRAAQGRRSKSPQRKMGRSTGVNPVTTGSRPVVISFHHDLREVNCRPHGVGSMHFMVYRVRDDQTAKWSRRWDLRPRGVSPPVYKTGAIDYYATTAKMEAQVGLAPTIGLLTNAALRKQSCTV